MMIKTISRIVPIDMEWFPDLRTELDEGSRLPPSHATDKPAETKRCESRGVWTLFDDTADIVLSVDGALAHHLGSIRGSLFCLAVEILGRPGCLVDEPIGLAFRVAP
jgi:hypothetical protein